MGVATMRANAPTGGPHSKVMATLKMTDLTPSIEKHHGRRPHVVNLEGLNLNVPVLFPQEAPHKPEQVHGELNDAPQENNAHPHCKDCVAQLRIRLIKQRTMDNNTHWL